VQVTPSGFSTTLADRLPYDPEVELAMVFPTVRVASAGAPSAEGHEACGLDQDCSSFDDHAPKANGHGALDRQALNMATASKLGASAPPNVELTGVTRQVALARRRKMNGVPRRRAKDACPGTSG
jgi:hypothetical protein